MYNFTKKYKMKIHFLLWLFLFNITLLAQEKPNGKYYIIENNKISVLEFKKDSVSEYRLKDGIETLKSSTKYDIFEKWGENYAIGIKGPEKYFIVQFHSNKDMIRMLGKKSIEIDSLNSFKSKVRFCKYFGMPALTEKYYNEVRKLKKAKDLNDDDISVFIENYYNRMVKVSSEIELFKKNNPFVEIDQYLITRYTLVESWIESGCDPYDVIFENSKLTNDQIDIFAKAHPEKANKLQQFAAFLSGNEEMIQNPLPPRAPDKE